MSEWYVDKGNYTAEEYLAIDEFLTEHDGQFLRLDSLDKPVFLPARRTDMKDIDAAIDEGFNFSRRSTDGSTIYCGPNSFTYSIVLPSTSKNPSKIFEEEIAPMLIEILEPFEEDLKVDTMHDSIRTGDEYTPSKVPSGRQLSGNGLWSRKDTMLCEGVIAVESWEDDNLDYLRLRDGERSVLENLPYVDADRNELESRFLDVFTNDNYNELFLDNEDVGRIRTLVEEKYDNKDWIYRSDVDLRRGDGFCMINKYDDTFY